MKFFVALIYAIGILFSFPIPNYSYQNEENVLYTCKGESVSFADNIIPILGTTGSLNFKLKGGKHELNCSSPVLYDLNLRGNTFEGEDPSIEIKSDGTLVVENDEGLYYVRNSKDYCVLRTAKQMLTLRVCRPNCIENKCFSKCCPHDEILSYRNDKKDARSLQCQLKPEYRSKKLWFVKSSWDLILNNNAVIQDLSSPTFSRSNAVSYIIPLPDFNGSYHKNLNKSHFYLLNDFKVAFCENTMWNVFELENKRFCVDAIQNFGKETSSLEMTSFAILIENSTDGFHEKIMKLAPETKKAIEDFQIIYYILCPMSLFFLLVIIIVYGLLWENLNNIHGLTVFSYIITLLLDYISWLCIPLESIVEDDKYPLADHANLFFSYSLLCWLTVINFDIWITFRKFRLSTNKLLGRYLIYASFAWVVPLLLVMFGIILDNKMSNNNGGIREDENCPPPNSPFPPAKLRQFIGRIFNQFLITGVLLAFNFIFIASTMYQMWSHNKNNNIDLRDSTHRKNSMIWICVKLFIVMGGVWILDTIPIMVLYYVYWNGQEHIAIDVGQDLRTFLQKLIYCEWFTECVSVVEAFVLFYIFVCKDSIYNQLWDKYPKLRGILSCLRKLNGCCQWAEVNQDVELHSNATYNSRKLSITASNY